MKHTSRPRTTVELSKSVNDHLNTYALAAGAAGVGLLALATPTEAKIIYTPAHAKLAYDQPLPVDLNRDGIVDFYLLRNNSGVSSRVLSACQTIRSYNGARCLTTMGANAIRAAVSKGRSFGAALRGGAKIQGGDRFPKFKAQLGEVDFNNSITYWRGPWFNEGKGVENRYLGLKFKITGRVHFGWARMTVTTTSNNFTATLTGYAYETIPGKAIIAGKTKGPEVTTVDPASLGHLAAGASAIPVWRVKQTAGTTR
jgi:hypothetical protein